VAVGPRSRPGDCEPAATRGWKRRPGHPQLPPGVGRVIRLGRRRLPDASQSGFESSKHAYAPPRQFKPSRRKSLARVPRKRGRFGLLSRGRVSPQAEPWMET